MARAVLSEEDKERGRLFVDALYKAGYPIGFAGWLRDSDDAGEPWRFYMATPLWTEDSPRSAAMLLARYLDVQGEKYGMSVLDIELGPVESMQMDAIRSTIGISPSEGIDVGTHGIRDLYVPRIGGNGSEEVFSPAIYLIFPKVGREAVKRMRRAFVSNLEAMEAA